MNINNSFLDDIKKRLDKIDQEREKLLTLSRQMVRNCSVAIKSIHREDDGQYQEKIKKVKENHTELSELVKLNPIQFYDRESKTIRHIFFL